MNGELVVRMLAGLMILLFFALSEWVHPYFRFGYLFIAFNLIQSVFTGFCPPVIICKKLGFCK